MTGARATAVTVIATIGVSSVASWIVHRSVPASITSKRTAVIVLGYPSRRSGEPSLLQRSRVRMAAESVARLDDGWMIVSGGATRHSAETEASVMARFAVERLGVGRALVEHEHAARSTWENVLYSVPLAEAGGAELIAIVSDPFHVERARRYLVRQRPDLAERIVRADGVRPFAHPWLSPILLVDFVRKSLREAARLRRQGLVESGR